MKRKKKTPVRTIAIRDISKECVVLADNKQSSRLNRQLDIHRINKNA